jgi:hypothetical protein
MINKLPIIGWILSAIGATSLAIPFWICWTYMGIGEKYFYFIPEVYLNIPFWNCVGLFIVIKILYGTLIPRIFYVSNTQTVEK